MAKARSERSLIATALVLATLFSCSVEVAFEVGAVRRHSPWQDDPYDTVLNVTQTAVAVLAVLLAVRLVSRVAGRGRPATPPVARAALALAVCVDLAAAAQWAAVAVGAHRAAWDGATAALVAALVVVTVSAVGLTWLGVRSGALRHDRDDPATVDLLDDLSAAALRLFGRCPTRPIAWVRRHVLAVFVGGSVVGSVVVVGALAVGEGWTDPWLIAWALVVEASANLAICLIGNAVVGAVRRTGRRRTQAEAVVASGCVSLQLAVAFHDALGRAVSGHPPRAVGELAQLTGAAALAGVVLATVVGQAVRRRGVLG